MHSIQGSQPFTRHQNRGALKKIKLEIIGIGLSQSQSGAYHLMLQEAGGNRRLGIVIGGSEAQAIALELEKMKPQRPLTHDLFRSFAEAFGIAITEVIITKYHDGVFYSTLVCEKGDEVLMLDSRTSDAVALAVRFLCPIFTTESVFRATDFALNETSDGEAEETDEDLPDPLSAEEEDDFSGEFAHVPLSELENMLAEAIAEEAFERASRIRDEINRRKESKD